MRYLYSFLLYIMQPLMWVRLLIRSIKAPAYRQRWLERYGFCRHKVKPHGILVHAVSVGETIAAVPLIQALQERYPDLPITVTTMTPTGSDRVCALLGDSVSHVYLPYDLPGAMKRFLSTVDPRLVIVMETELWPNFIHQLYKKRIPLIIANARLSARSARGYAKLGRFIRNVLTKISLIAAQNEQDGKRFVRLGLPSSHLVIIGSLKYDIALTQAHRDRIHALQNEWHLSRPVMIAASTHPGEEEILLKTFQKLLHTQPDLLLILVPRHPERFKEVEKQVAKIGLNYILRSQNKNPSPQTQVIVGDTMGELNMLFGLADIAFIGGSLVPHGGHNPLEAALHSLPIVMGPHTFNFTSICQRLSKNNALITSAEDPEALFTVCHTLLTHPQEAEKIGNNAARVLQQNQGSLERLLTLIDRALHA